MVTKYSDFVHANYPKIQDIEELVALFVYENPDSPKWLARKYLKRVISRLTEKNIIRQNNDISVISDKKEADFDYKEILEHALKSQELYAKNNLSQTDAVFKINSNKPIYVVFLGDTHIGSSGMDIKAFRKITEEILSIDNLYVILLGDLMEMAIKMRSVHEVMGNIIPPKWQFKILDAWLEEIKHKVICATWDNHCIMREENVLGWSPTAELLSKKVIYHSGIGHINIHVNEQVYKLAVSHFFRGNSIFNPNHELGRYIRNEYYDADIVAQGDRHVPAIQILPISGRIRALIKCGTHNVNSGYAKRFYSLKTFDYMPVVKLWHDEKEFTPFLSLKHSDI
jgi:hypothetical protein